VSGGCLSKLLNTKKSSSHINILSVLSTLAGITSSDEESLTSVVSEVAASGREAVLAVVVAGTFFFRYGNRNIFAAKNIYMARGSIADLSLLFTSYHITWRKRKQASKVSVSENNGCKEIRPIFTPEF